MTSFYRQDDMDSININITKKERQKQEETSFEKLHHPPRYDDIDLKKLFFFVKTLHLNCHQNTLAIYIQQISIYLSKTFWHIDVIYKFISQI